MWEAARDLALDKPKIPGDVLMRMMGRNASRARRAERPWPQLDETLERMLSMMAQVLVVEVFAEGTFDWGFRLLSNPAVSARRKRRARWSITSAATRARTSSICARRCPRCARGRCARSTGSTIAGRTVVDGMLHNMLREMTRNRPREQRDDVRENLDGRDAGRGESAGAAGRVRCDGDVVGGAAGDGVRGGGRARRQRPPHRPYGTETCSTRNPALCFVMRRTPTPLVDTRIAPWSVATIPVWNRDIDHGNTVRQSVGMLDLEVAGCDRANAGSRDFEDPAFLGDDERRSFLREREGFQRRIAGKPESAFDCLLRGVPLFPEVAFRPAPLIDP